MLTTLLHVTLFVAVLIGLLAIKQRRLRHIPTRRTHISRRSAEGTVWLQRAVNAALDMLHCALAEQCTGKSVGAIGGGFPTSSNDGSQHPQTSWFRASQAPRSGGGSEAGTAAAAPGDESGSDNSAEVLSDLPFLNTLKAQLEEQISALLEDKGIASFADFRIKDWGGKPPAVKAVCLSHGGGSSSSNGGSSNIHGTALNNNSSGGGGGGSSVYGGMDGTPGGQRGGVPGPNTGSGATMTGSPTSLGSQHYPSFGESQPLPSSVTGRGNNNSNSSSGGHLHTRNSPNRPPGERCAGEGLPSSDAPYASTSMRYRNANGSLFSSGEEVSVSGTSGGPVGRDRSVAGSMVHPGRIGGGSSNAGIGNGSNLGMGMSVPDMSGGLVGSSSTAAAVAAASSPPSALPSTGKNASDTTRSLSVLEAEAEVEYSGNFSISLNADLPIARGRYLQLYASISDVRIFAAHVRLRLTLEYEPATVESPQPQPYLCGTLWLVSDPVFDVAFHSRLTQYRIRDFFLIPKLVKFFLLRFVRNRLRPTSSSSANTAPSRHTNARRRRQGSSMATGGVGAGGGGGSTPGSGSGGAAVGTSEEVAAEVDCTPSDASGLSFRIQLPADIVDGGEQWWSSMARDTMSEQPAPFSRAYHQ
jgi:hypothetical protein